MTQIAFLLYPDMTALDAVGPYEVLARLPGADVKFVSSTPGPIRTDVDMLRQFGAEPVAERVVTEGEVVTAAGVSSGIDMALTLAAMEAGEDEARALQLVIEYDPDPPFDSGSFEKADPATQQRATAHMVPDAEEAQATA